MNTNDMKLFQDVLETASAGLRHTMRTRRGDVANECAVEHSAEECERISVAGQREIAFVLIDQEAKRQRSIKAALVRIKAGEYGTCVDCENPISVKRLKAIPWADRCVGCQDAADHGPDRSDSSRDLFAA